MRRTISKILTVLFILTILPSGVFGAEGNFDTLPEKRLPDAYVGVEYDEIMTMFDTMPSATRDIRIYGELPKGIEMSYEIRESPSSYDTTYTYIFFLKGNPHEQGYSKFTLSITDISGEQQFPFSMYVTDLYSKLAYATEGIEYNETLLTLDESDVVTQKEGTVLPDGIELVQKVADGKREVSLKGTPMDTGDFYINLDITVNEETTVCFYKLTVNAAQIQLVTGYENEIFKDELFAYPNAEMKIDGAVPKGLSIEKVTKTVGETEAYAFVISGIPEELGEYEFTVIFTADGITILSQQYLVTVKNKMDNPSFEGSFAYHVYDSVVMFTEKKPVIGYKLYGNIPQGIAFEVSDKNNNGEYECSVVGTPEECMNQKYIFEAEVQTEGNEPQRRLCVLYVAERRVDIGPLPMYYAPDVPLQAVVGEDIEGLQSMEFLLPISNVTLEKQESGEYKLQITYPIDDSKIYLVPVLVKHADKETNKTVETIIQYKVVITESILGDSNLDGKVDTADAVTILKYSAGMSDANIYFEMTSDVNGDCLINTADAVLILKYSAGMITSF